MKSLFNTVPFSKPKLNKFNLSHERKFSMNMGDMIPVMCQEVIPGDKFRVQASVMMRMAPMLAPIMHRVNFKIDNFFVPTRIIWNEWEDFITGGKMGTSAPVSPYIESTQELHDLSLFLHGSLVDYMGLPTTNVIETQSLNGKLRFSALPFRAYQLIYNEYYRDETLSTEVPFSRGSGDQAADAVELLQIRRSAWKKDYFTSCLPFAQRGGDVSLPIQGDSTDVTYKDQSLIKKTSDGSNVPNNEKLGSGNLDPQLRAGDPTPASGQQVRIENIDSFSFDATDLTINVLRRAIALQTWLEKNARGGYRYIEQMFSHFGVVSSDARLQRPEYLSGSSNPIVVSEVLSTFQEIDGEIPQGNMAGHGIGVGNAADFNKRFEEHGVIISILRVLPEPAYMNGVPRMYQRNDKLDYYWPEFAHLGEQEVKRRELLWHYANMGTQDATFGYQSRYAEYKYAPSTVHGDMKSTLKYWHMARDFGMSIPELDDFFIKCDPTHRIFNVDDPAVHKLYVLLYNKVDALRPMPYFGTPSSLG